MPSKRFKKLPEKTIELPADSIEKLLPIVKKNCTTKFDESVDLSFQINNKQKKSEINIRTVVNLPGGSGKKIKVAVVCEDGKISEAKDAGADIVGGDDFIEKIKAGEINFEKLIIGNAAFRLSLSVFKSHSYNISYASFIRFVLLFSISFKLLSLNNDKLEFFEYLMSNLSFLKSSYEITFNDLRISSDLIERFVLISSIPEYKFDSIELL